MDLTAEVIRLPKVANLDLGTFAEEVAPALEEAGAILLAQLREQSPGGIADTWDVPQVQPVGGVVALSVTNPHPGALPLDKGAHWPGPMPPWGPDTSLGQWAHDHGIPAFLVARALQRNGLTARHFVQKSLDAVQGEIAEVLLAHGIMEWLINPEA